MHIITKSSLLPNFFFFDTLYLPLFVIFDLSSLVAFLRTLQYFLHALIVQRVGPRVVAKRLLE